MDKIPILAGLIVGIPCVVIITLAVIIMQSDLSQHVVDHDEIIKLQSQLNNETQKTQNILNFLADQQIPFDRSVIKMNDTLNSLKH